MAGTIIWSSIAIIPLLISICLVSRWMPLTDVVSLQCRTLHQHLGDKVSFPEDNTYTTSIQSYFSAQESELAPGCIVSPATTKDVFVAIKTLNELAKAGKGQGKGQCPFAVRGGGYTPWAGSANIDSGVTVDLRAIKDVSVNGDRTITSIGGGAIWGDVYSKLDAINLAVSGGRVSKIGVGGLITGGGMSFFAPRYGFACDNVVNFEVVLASGDVVNANAHENSDLWFALKGGSNNFGIITRFDLKTFEQGKIWGGIIINSIDTRVAQFKAFENLNAAADYDTYAAVINSYGYSSAAKSWGVVNSIVYTKPEAFPKTLAPFTDIQPQYSSTLRIASLSDFTLEQAAFSPNGGRQLYATTTIGNSASLLNEVFDLFNASLQPIKSTPGLVYSLTYQALPASITEKAAATGGNALGLEPKDGPLVITLLTTSWSNAADDENMNAAVKGLFAQVERRAQALDLNNRWIYLNYAAKWQDVIGSYGPENVAKLQSASKKFDPDGLFQYREPGGYKLFHRT